MLRAVAPGRVARSCGRGILVLASKREIDPWVVAPMEVIGNWAAAVWKQGGCPQTAEAALRLYPEAWKTGLPKGGVSRIRGPMGALCQAVGRIGWRVDSPAELRDRTGYVWDLTRHAPASVRWAARRDGSNAVWNKAAQGPRGRTDLRGLDGDSVDEDAMRRMLRNKEDGGRGVYGHRVAVMTGAVWTRERLHRAGRVPDARCPHCGAEHGDAEHLWGPCPTWEHARWQARKGE